MKRFFTLLFLFLTFSSFGQNLIPDPSAEDYALCPTGLGILETWLPTWNTYRGTPDYFNNCSNGLGNSNPFGFQEPMTGNGYLGAVTFTIGLENAREYFGIQLIEPLEIGQTYYISFHASLAYEPTAANYASNNLGFLLMTENYLLPDGQAEIPNFAHYSIDTLFTDTANWVNFSANILADSAYTSIAFGNFFDDSNTLFVTDSEFNGYSYYYFDNFCVSLDSVLCDQILSTKSSYLEGHNLNIKLWPNPANDFINFSIHQDIFSYEILDSSGRILVSKILMPTRSGNIRTDLIPGMYILKFYTTEKDFIIKRFVVQ